MVGWSWTWPVGLGVAQNGVHAEAWHFVVGWVVVRNWHNSFDEFFFSRSFWCVLTIQELDVIWQKTLGNYGRQNLFVQDPRTRQLLALLQCTVRVSPKGAPANLALAGASLIEEARTRSAGAIANRHPSAKCRLILVRKFATLEEKFGASGGLPLCTSFSSFWTDSD